MAGSLTWREYQADNGQFYSIKCDESNANAICGTSTVFLPLRTANHPQIPKGVKLRYALTTNIANPKQRRKFIIGTQPLLALVQNNPSSPIVAPDYPTTNATGAGTAVNWSHTYYSGESRRAAPGITAIDTGLDDGTTTQ
jgi:hypothetical protein